MNENLSGLRANSAKISAPSVVLLYLILFLMCVSSKEVLGEGTATANEVRPAAAKTGKTRVIEEVMVTATKRDTSLQDTGIAISVLAADDLDFRDMKNLEDIENSVPGLKIGAVLGTPLINIRGIGLNFAGGLGNPGVATHYDGIYLPRAGSVAAASVDLAQVEVLRGPQGTLYGRNSTGGSVNFLSKKPHDEFGAGLTIGGGDYGREFYEAYVEGPAFHKNTSLRIFMRRDHFDGYGINETTGHSIGDNDAVMGHVGVVHQATENLDIYLSYTRRDDTGGYPYSTAMTTVTPVLANVLNNNDIRYSTDLQSFKDYNIKGLRDPYSDKFTEIGNLTVTWDIGDYNFKSITGYVGHQRYEELSAPEIEEFVVYIYRNDTSNARSQEFNLSSSAWFDGRLNWLLGAYYQNDKGASPYQPEINVDEVLGASFPLNTGFKIVYAPTGEVEDITRAVFLDGYWSLREDLRLVAGLRYSEESRTLVQTLSPYISDAANSPGIKNQTQPFLAQLGIFPSCENLRSIKEFTSRDPKIGIEWDTTEDMMIYLQYQTGFKAGGFNSTGSCEQSYEPEEIKSVEIGLKSTFFDESLTINAAAFDYDYTGYQVEKAVGFQSVIENAAAASLHGFEVESSYTPLQWFTVDMQYSYIDARYDEYFAKDNFKSTSNIALNAPLEDLSGNRLSRAPKHSVNLGLTFSYAIDRFGLGMTRLRLEAYYSDEVYFREFNAENEKQDEYSTYNAFYSLDSENMKYTFSMFVKNISDKRYMAGQIAFDSIKYTGAIFAPPRTFGASIAMRI